MFTYDDTLHPGTKHFCHSDPDMYIFFEKGNNRNNKANNKYTKSCDPKQESKHIT